MCDIFKQYSLLNIHNNHKHYYVVSLNKKMVTFQHFVEE